MLNIAPTRIRKGLFRLLTGPSDIERWDAHVGMIDRDSASPAHRELFQRYCDALAEAVPKATSSWLGELNGWASVGRTPEEAEREMWATYVAGPAWEPFFVALVRSHWLQCDALNKVTPQEQAVRPEQLLLGWLQGEPARAEWVAVIACMPYWPLGIDDAGRWI